MKVKMTAVKTTGMGCIKGDTKEYHATKIEDKGSYWNVIIHENRSVRFAKDAWRKGVC